MDTFDERIDAIKAFKLGQYQKVLSFLSHYLEDDSKEYEFFYMRGTCLYFFGYYKRALKDLNRAILLCDSFPKYYYQRHLIHLKLKNEVDATADIENACSIEGCPPQFFYHLAIDLFKRSSYSQALELVDKGISLGFSNSEVDHFKGVILCNLEKFMIGIEYLEKALNNGYSNSETYQLLGFSYFKLGVKELNEGSMMIGIKGMPMFQTHIDCFRRAIENYSHTIKDDPNIPSSYFYRGMSYNYLNNFKSAEEDLSSAIRLDPTQEAFYSEWSKLQKD